MKQNKNLLKFLTKNAESSAANIARRQANKLQLTPELFSLLFANNIAYKNRLFYCNTTTLNNINFG